MVRKLRYSPIIHVNLAGFYKLSLLLLLLWWCFSPSVQFIFCGASLTLMKHRFPATINIQHTENISRSVITCHDLGLELTTRAKEMPEMALREDLGWLTAARFRLKPVRRLILSPKDLDTTRTTSTVNVVIEAHDLTLLAAPMQHHLESSYST